MAKKLISLGIVTLLLFSTIGFTACFSNEIVETDYFRVELNNKEGYATVLGLTELGQKQEILAFPMFVNELPVKQVCKTSSFFSVNRGYIDNPNLMKIYIPHTVENIYSTKINQHSEIVANRIDIKDTYFYQIHGSESLVHLVYDSQNTILKLPNVAFRYNYYDAPNQGYYWIDYVNGTNLYILPLDPIRENHSFAGWFLEPGCFTQWNGQMPQSADEILNLYAKWQEK